MNFCRYGEARPRLMLGFMWQFTSFLWHIYLLFYNARMYKFIALTETGIQKETA